MGISGSRSGLVPGRIADQQFYVYVLQFHRSKISLSALDAGRRAHALVATVRGLDEKMRLVDQ